MPPKIVTETAYGTLRYVTDVKVDGMLHARIIRPPAAGCGPVAVDESSIAGIPGVRIVREKELVAVVAEHEWDAVRAATTLKVTWAPPCMPFPTMEKLYDHIREAKAIGRQVPIERGDAAAALKAASRVVEADYEWPFQIGRASCRERVYIPVAVRVSKSS